MDAGRGGDEELQPGCLVGAGIQSSLCPGAERRDVSVLRDTAGEIIAECGSKNMWINEQEGLDISGDDCAGREAACAEGSAALYPPAASGTVCNEELLANSPDSVLAQGDTGLDALRGEDNARGSSRPAEGAVAEGGGSPGSGGDADSGHRSRGVSSSEQETGLSGTGNPRNDDSLAHASTGPRTIPPSHETSSHTSLEFSDDSIGSGSQASKDSPSVRKGRFVLKPADRESMETVSTLRYRKGRFHVTETLDLMALDRTTCKMIVNLLSMQNKQTDILFDMVKNISGEEKLFQKEFTHLSNEVYELIGMLRKHTNA